MVTFKVNNKEVQFEPGKTACVQIPVKEGQPYSGFLLDYLREDLGMTGTKCGCQERGCGACTVLVDGKATRSCMVKMDESIAGKEITTIEGLGTVDNMDFVQQAFMEYNAVQCGFCTPGLVMAAHGLLNSNPNPTEADIKKALKINLCRCATYPRVIGAVLKAAAVKRGDPNPPVYVAEDQSKGGSFIGKSMPRKDLPEKLCGVTKFYADYRFDKEPLYGKAAFVPVPAGKLLSLDVSEARAVPGVQLVLTAEDIPYNRFGVLTGEQPVLVEVGGEIRHIGEYLAVVFADTRAAAVKAAAAVKCEVEEYPGIYSIEEALKEGAHVIQDPNNKDSFFGYMRGEHGNLTKDAKMHRGNLAKAEAEADHVISGHFVTKPQEHAWIEPDGAVACMEPDGAVAVYSPNQSPFADRDQIAAALKVSNDKVHVVHVPCGGAFGGKTELTNHIYVALASMKTGRPARMVNSREDSLRTHPKRHGYNMDYRVAVNNDGKIQGMYIDIVADGGAYQSWSPRVLEQGMSYASGPYYVPNFNMRVRGITTNNMVKGAFRGFGAIQSHFASESMMDMVAHELNMDPITIREINGLERGMPMSTGQMLNDKSGIEYKKTLVEARKLVEEKLKPMKAKIEAEGGLAGIGIACGWRSVAGGLGPVENAGADFELEPDGRVSFRIACTEMGQGSHTSLAQMASEVTGVHWEDYDITAGDTFTVPFGGGVMASRGTYLWGFPTITAGEEFKEKILAEAAKLTGKDAKELDMKNSVIFDKSGAEVTNLKELAAKGVKVNVRVDYQLPDSHPVVENTNEDHAIPDEEYRVHHTVAYCTLITLVEIDPATGGVTVRYIGQVTDGGRLINPDNVRQQIEGGLILGLSFGMNENFDIENGWNKQKTLGKVKIARITDLPDEMEIKFCDIDDPTGPFGAKGVAEICVLAPAPAVCNAIYDAIGLRISELPVADRAAEIKEAAQKTLAARETKVEAKAEAELTK